MAAHMLTLRTFLEKHVMPRAGGLYDQHPLYVRSMQAIMQGESRITKIIKARSDATKSKD